MSDWGKVLLTFLQGKSAVILLVFIAFVALMPIPVLEQFKQEYEPWVTLAGLFAVSSVIVNIVVWLKDQLIAKSRQQKEENSATEAIWGRFTRLHPEMQMFVICLFFSGRMSATARLNDPMVAALRDQGFLTVINGGMATLDAGGEVMNTVMISQPMLEFMERHSEEFRKQGDGIMSARALTMGRECRECFGCFDARKDSSCGTIKSFCNENSEVSKMNNKTDYLLMSLLDSENGAVAVTDETLKNGYELQQSH